MSERKYPIGLQTFSEIIRGDGKGYALPYNTAGRPVVKVGVKMNPATRSVENWIIA